MQAVQGYYDGDAIQLLGKLRALPNQRIIVTIMDEFVPASELEQSVDSPREAVLTASARDTTAQSLRGVLAEYADPVLTGQEKGAWERAMIEKHRVSEKLALGQK